MFYLWAPKSLQIVIAAIKLKDSLEDQASQSYRKSTLNTLWKNWGWSWSSSILVTWWEELTHWKRLWCWERLNAVGEEGNRGWDGWMVSLIRWTWTGANSGRWWGTGKPGVLQSIGSRESQTWLDNWTTTPWRESYDKPRQCIKKQRHHVADTGLYTQCYGFSGSHVRVWELDHKGSWTQKNWCFRIVLEKTLESPLDSKIKPANPKGNQPWILIGKLMLKLQYFGHLMWRVNSQEKTLMLGKIEGKRRGRQRMNGWMASLTQWTWVWANSGR